jgi:non-heme chloroperoxidase
MVMVYFAIAAPAAPVMTASNITLKDGVRLHYLQQGPLNGPAAIFLHGYSDSSFSFSRVMPMMPTALRVVAPDFRGHGASDKPASGYKITELASDVLEVMDALELPSAIVVGHSMGSFVAQAIAERAPHRVSTLALVGSGPVARNDVIDEIKKTVDALVDPVERSFVREFQYATIAQPVPESFMNTAIENSRQMPAAIWRAIMEGMADFEPAQPRPRVRTVVIGGTLDAVFSVSEQTALAAQFVGARLHLFDDVGHAPHWERPEAFVRELLGFVK